MLDPLGKQRVMDVLRQATRRDHTTGIISEFWRRYRIRR